MSVTMQDLHRVVLKLANQSPTRYYLHVPSKREGGQRFALEVMESSGKFPERLDKELRGIDFEEGYVEMMIGDYPVFRWEAEREDI